MTGEETLSVDGDETTDRASGMFGEGEGRHTGSGMGLDLANELCVGVGGANRLQVSPFSASCPAS